MFTNYTEKLRLFNIIYGSLFPASVNINILHKNSPFLKKITAADLWRGNENYMYPVYFETTQNST